MRFRSTSPRAGLVLLGTSVALAVLGAAPTAAADDVVVKLMLNGFVADPRMDPADVSTGPGIDPPGVLVDRNVGLHADGPMIGGGFRGTFVIDRTRLSLGMNLFGVDQAHFEHEPIPEDLFVRTGLVWGESIDLALGREFRIGPVFPYLDLRVGMNLVAANLELHSWDRGLLGSTGYSNFSFCLGPMPGVFVPLSEAVFVDLAGYAGLVGAERYAGFAGFGIWIPGSHL